MYLFFSSLIEENKVDKKFQIVFSLVFAVLATNSVLLMPVLISLYILLLLVLLVNRHRFLNWFRQNPIFFQIIYLAFFIGFIFELWVLSGFIYFKIGSVFAFFVAWIITILWTIRISLDMQENPRGIILKGKTSYNKLDFNWSDFITIFILVAIISIFIISIQIAISPIGFQDQHMIWLILLPLVLLPVSLDQLVITQYKWNNTEGVISWRYLPVEMPDLDHFPSLIQYSKYLKETPEPDFDYLSYLDKHKKDFTRKCEKLDYLQFVSHFTFAMGNWGRKASDYLHLLHLFVLSSLSKYHLFGLIPKYQRYIFYTYLETLMKMGIQSDDWTEILLYEYEQGKDELHVLDWVVGVSYDETHYDDPWRTYWQGKIYLGKSGYIKAQEELSEISQFTIPISPPWKAEIYQVALAYVKDFAGKNSRQILKGDLSLQGKLRYLAAEKDEMMYKQERKIHNKQTVQIVSNPPRQKLSKQEKRKRINQAFSPDIQPSIKDEFVVMRNRIRSSFSQEGILLVGKIGIVAIILSLNIWGLEYALIQLSLEDFGEFSSHGVILFCEALIILMLMWDPQATERQAKQMAEIMERSTVNHTQVTIEDQTSSRRLLGVIYAVILFFIGSSKLV